MCQKHKSFLFATLVILFIQFFCLFFANHTYSSTIIRGEFLAIWTVWAIWTVEKSNRKIRNAELVIEIPIWRTVSGINQKLLFQDYKKAIWPKDPSVNGYPNKYSITLLKSCMILIPMLFQMPRRATLGHLDQLRVNICGHYTITVVVWSLRTRLIWFILSRVFPTLIHI